MDHKEWREYEEKCIQERPPACMTTCPVHVDARGFSSAMKAGNVNKAWEVFRKTVPFPGIIARICDHPCESACKRGEVGDPVAIGALEKACATLQTAPPVKLSIAPSKRKRVAVVGGGLSGLAAAYDLAVKGYGVVLFEAGERLGGAILSYPEATLPKQVIEEDISVMERLGVEVRFEATVGEMVSMTDLQRDFDAVYVGQGKSAGAHSLLEHSAMIDPVTFATNIEGIFAGGSWRTGSSSPILSLSDGRRAATSIDRYLQNVSLTAVRENEGPHETSLYTNLEGIEPLPLVTASDAKAGYMLEEAMEEAGRCIECECMECVKNCEYLHQFKAYPKVYARQINQNLRIVKGLHGANTLINSCTLCGLCKEVCPEDFDMSVLVREARTEMVNTGKMPPSAHAFPLQELEVANSEAVAFTRHQPGKGTSRYAFFPGCELSGSSPDHVERAYAYLTDKLDGGVGMMMRCCGATAEAAGETKLFAESLQKIRQEWQEMGQPQMVLACSTCYQTFKTHMPEMEIVSLWELYDEYGLPEGAGTKATGVVAVHDACTTRYETVIQESVRSLLKKLDFTIEELPNSREKTACCGAGGLVPYANRQMANDMAKRRASESQADYVAYCAMCRDSLAAQGKKTYHLLDLIYGDADLSAPAKRGPSYSKKRQNRLQLNAKMRESWWGEMVALEKKSYQSIPLKISDEVEQILDARMVLEEDIQKVIEHAEQTGEVLVDKQSGHLIANFRPTSVTFWVEYSKDEDGYVIHNAYSHRMTVEGNE